MVTDRFMHIGVPHTGGGALHLWLHKIKGTRLINKEPHKPYSWMVEKCRSAGVATPPAFALARNPWEWNVAIWAWIRSIKRRWFCGSFADLIELQKYTRHWALPDLNTAGISAAWDYLEADKAQHFGTLEHYEQDIPRILMAIMPDLTSTKFIQDRIAAAGKRHYKDPPDGIPATKPYQEYYSTPNRKQVAELEAGIIERFGYSFSDKGRDF